MRNARQAVDDAVKARSLLTAADWKASATLAAAYAELGDFAAAVQNQEAALSLGPPPREASALRDRLALYRADKPYHEPLATAAVHEPAKLPTEPPLAVDVFELRLDVPDGTTVEIEGTDYGAQRTFSWENLGAGESYVARAKIVFADGGTARRAFRIRGGRRVRLTARAAERIVYSFADSDAERFNLYRLDPVTYESNLVADDAAIDEDPKLAPDGATIAYLREETKGRSIFLIGVDGSANRRLVPSAPAPIQGDVAWAPDSTHLVFGAWQGGGSADLYVADVRTNLMRHLDRGYGPVYSPDGNQILYCRSLPTQAEPSVSVMATSGGESRALASGHYPTWSPDGTRIAFLQRLETRERRGGTPVKSFHLCVARSDGGDPRVLARADEYAWSPDGESLAFITADGLFVIQADGSGRRMAARGDPSSRNPEVLTYPCWSPDGLRIVYVRQFEAPVGSTITSAFMPDFEAAQLEIVGLDGTAPVIVAPRRSGFYSAPDWK